MLPAGSLRSVLKFILIVHILGFMSGCGNSAPVSSSAVEPPIEEPGGGDGGGGGGDGGGDPPGPPPASKQIRLQWNPNPDVIAGYIVYYGNSGATATNTASVLSINDPAFTASAPSVTYDAQADFGVSSGENICFRIKAYDTAGAFSDWSSAICNTI